MSQSNVSKSIKQLKCHQTFNSKNRNSHLDDNDSEELLSDENEFSDQISQQRIDLRESYAMEYIQDLFCLSNIQKYKTVNSKNKTTQKTIEKTDKELIDCKSTVNFSLDSVYEEIRNLTEEQIYDFNSDLYTYQPQQLFALVFAILSRYQQAVKYSDQKLY